MAQDQATASRSEGTQGFTPPTISLPKGGGAIRGIGEKLAANPVTGTGSMTVPIATSPGRSGFGPQLSLSYDSGAGNGPFGFGWSLSLPAITRKTDKGLPQYRDADESDVFILSGAEDLVPVLVEVNGQWQRQTLPPRNVGGAQYRVERYRPRIEGLFARIERWTNVATGEAHWRSISRDNVTTLYGKDNNSRIFDPADRDPAHPTRIFSWLICQSYDDKGNAIVYEYAEENSDGVALSQAHERNRTPQSRNANRYLKRIKYGNRHPNRDGDWNATDATLLNDWMFEAVFDYGEGHYEEVALGPGPEAEQHRFVRAAASVPQGSAWPARPDPFSSYRAGFEVRTYRRCRRVLMFHRFAELGPEPYLVRSTELDYDDLDYSKNPTVDVELVHPGSTRTASFIRAITQSGFVQDNGRPALDRGGVNYLTYLKKSLPPLEFEYSQAAVQEDLRELDPESLENLPYGLDGRNYQWVDLDGEGVSGILTEQADAWFYKPNLGDGHFGPAERVAALPSLAALSAGRQQLLDLAGDGQLDLAEFGGPTPGFYERTDDQQWERFTPFSSLPSVAWDDPNLRFVDLDGDGHADVLITEHEALTWHRSLAEEGFGPARRVTKAGDEEQGPRLVFADGTQSVYLADMSGDGLTDLARIRNGEVCYWPNLGYGRFGAKVTMDHAPWFDSPDEFDQRRIRLADVDGSGNNDIIYLGRDGVRLYFNQSGNRWSESRPLSQFPHADNLSAVTAVDLFGNGTACLVWSSPLPGDTRRPVRYIDLMGGRKPHLLTAVKNNLGAETHVHYAASTEFYLADKKAGKPWITRLPFPVHVVDRAETYDRISRNRFVTRYAYHHGYFDGIEREFRGFGMVEQRDTEEFAALGTSDEFPTGDNIDAASHVPPVLTKTWFHTGVYLGRGHVSDFFAGLLDANDVGEYYREPGLTDAQARARLLDDTVLPDGLTVEEEREACRALKGSMLRREVYALDGTDKRQHPYTVTEQNFTIRVVQPQGGKSHAVFFTHARESISYHYERNPADPRIGHALTLEVDEFGNVLQAAAIGYGRRQADMDLLPADQAKQTQILITYTENRVTNAVEAPDDHRAPLPCESRTYELTGLTLPADSNRFTFDEVLEAESTAIALDYEKDPTAGLVQKRVIEHVRTYYRREDLTGPLPLGDLQSLALPFESYKLAFTPGLVAEVYGGRASDVMLENEARYVHTEGDANWWIPSGRVFYSPDTADPPPQEITHGRAHFFLPRRYRDPFHTDAVGTETFVTYDAYDLLVAETRDALGNRITVGERRVDPTQPLVLPGHDYRVLQPALMMDPNRNRSAVAFDALGMVVGTAVMGKPEDNPVPGDRLAATFHADLTQAEIDQFFANPKGPMAASLLDDATTRVVYDLTAYWRDPDPAKKPPAFAATLARETHASEPGPAGGLQIQASFSYSDGFGREIEKKIQAEPGPVPQRDANGRIIVDADGQPLMTPNDVSPRWVGSGWTVFNNKGKPVRQYEPFFTDRHHFEFDVRTGVSPVLFYDPVERVVATLHPNHTWEKVVFDPWRQETWDVNDTVLVVDPKTDPDLGGYFARLANAEYLPTWHALRTDPAHAVAASQRWPSLKTRDAERSAAEKAAIHAATPTIAHGDTLGRTFLTVAHNRFKYTDTPRADPPVEGFHRTRVVIDIEGNQREVVDARGRVVMRYAFNMLGATVHHTSMESGARWTFNDVTGKPLYAWTSRDHRFRTAYDSLRRPTESWLSVGAGAEMVIGRNTYGEGAPNPEANNLRGKVVEIRDQAGVVTSDSYDFKGNPLRSQRRLAQAHRTTLDWVGAVPLQLATYTSCTRYDALNRPTQLIAPHSDQPGATVNVIQPIYNEANLLERIDAWFDQSAEPAAELDAATADLHALTDIEYNAKGQRTQIDRGTTDGRVIRTSYAYDRETWRLVHVYTRRGVDRLTGQGAGFAADCDNPAPPPPTVAAPEPPPADASCGLQNLHYTYDPLGNIASVRDDAQQTIYFRNRRVEPSADYTYDASYRLIEATWREHLGQLGGVANAPTPHSYNDASRVRLLSADAGGQFAPYDGNAMGRYLERYRYDEVGNLLEMQHRGSDPAHPGWVRTYAYDEVSQLEPAARSNRLTSTTVGGTTEAYSTAGDGYDAHGNMLRMPHLDQMQWDFKDHLQMSRRQAVNAGDAEGQQHHGEQTWYVYDSAGQRVRKVTESAGEQILNERVYLGGFEIFRQHGANALARETLHLMDGRQRIAMVDTRTQGSEPGLPRRIVRYQCDDHLGSASLELDDQARVISYEEYTPFGSTSYQAVRNAVEVPQRYRYTSHERDEESGLCHHGERYYAPWLGKWTSADPEGMVDGVHLFRYVRNNPIALRDPSGRTPEAMAAGKAWERQALDLVKKSIPTVGQVTVKATINGKEVTSVLDALGRDANGWVVLESKLSPGTELRDAQKLIREHLASGKSVTIAASDKAKIAEIRNTLKVSPDATVSTSRYKIIHQGNAGQVLGELNAIPKGHGTVLHASGELTTHSPEEMRKITEVVRKYPGLDSKAIVEKARKELTDEAAQKALKATEKAGKELLETGGKQVLQEGGEWVAKKGTKKLMSVVPVGGILGEIIFAEPDATAGEVIVRGIGSEIGIGPLDITTGYDILTSDFVKNAKFGPMEDDTYIYYPGEMINKKTGEFQLRPGPKW